MSVLDDYPFAGLSSDYIEGLQEGVRLAEAERDEMRDQCAGCMTPDEKDETIAELAAERDAALKLLDNILAADSAYRKALDDDYGGEQLAEAFGNVWDALKEAQAGRLALNPRGDGGARE